LLWFVGDTNTRWLISPNSLGDELLSRIARRMGLSVEELLAPSGLSRRTNADSLDVVEFVMELEDELGLTEPS
jgi:acyl carrier protein